VLINDGVNKIMEKVYAEVGKTDWTVR